MNKKTFSVFDAYVYAIKTVVDNMRLFLLAQLTLYGLGFSGILAGMFFNRTAISLWAHKVKTLLTAGLATKVTIMQEMQNSGWNAYPLIISGIVSFFIYMCLWLGYQKMILQLHDEGVSSLSMLFGSWHLVLRAIGTFVIFMLLFFIGLICFILPGLYIMYRFCFCMLILIDQNTGILESLKKSWRLTQGYGWSCIALLLVYFVLGSIGIGPYIFTMLTGGPLMARVYRLLQKAEVIEA